MSAPNLVARLGGKAAVGYNRYGRPAAWAAQQSAARWWTVGLASQKSLSTVLALALGASEHNVKRYPHRHIRSALKNLEPQEEEDSEGGPKQKRAEEEEKRRKEEETRARIERERAISWQRVLAIIAVEEEKRKKEEVEQITKEWRRYMEKGAREVEDWIKKGRRRN
ncbi:stress response protein NST1-like [Belonocnema kinseyi]|uniref:stress response protein NST1-like n=1 Tax=Belonocnema kinseyi TaxID=2817044 RepID=UPI00143D583E|nr:stress response protein NST1-like [Belonocnema kinseyi]